MSSDFTWIGHDPPNHVSNGNNGVDKLENPLGIEK